MEPALEVIGRRRDDRPCLDRDGGLDDLVGRQQASAPERSAGDRDTDGRITAGTIEPLGPE